MDPSTSRKDESESKFGTLDLVNSSHAPRDETLAQQFVQEGDVFGSYRLLEAIGEGAFGIVWKAKTFD